MSRVRVLSLVAGSLALLVLVGLGLLARVGAEGQTAVGGESTSAAGTLAAGRPNVIFIVADDLDKSLLPYLPNVRRLIRDAGADLMNFYVEQSTCCTSRATILSGKYAHNHHVIANTWPQGGYDRWKLTGQPDSLPVWLDDAGYQTGLMGKYFNEYPYHSGLQGATWAEVAQLRHYVPPGWDNWLVPVMGNAYGQFHYRLNVNQHVEAEPRDEYLDSVLGEHALTLLDGSGGFDFAEGGQFLYYASYSPHTPYAYPEEYADDFADVRYPRTPDFDERDVSDKFGVTRLRPRLSAAYKRQIDETFRDRIRSVQVLDRNIGALVDALADEGALDNTYLVFTSDNGYIMGGHRREIGKYNHFQQTVNVPFFVRGPGIAPGTRIEDPAGNIDIAPTIADIAGAEVPDDVDGVSLLPRLTGGPELTRKYLLLGRDLIPTEHTAPTPLVETPEEFVMSERASRLNDFVGVVSGRFKLIRYTRLRHEELYDLKHDPYELDNLLAGGRASYDAMKPSGQAVVRNLRRVLDQLVDCRSVDCLL